jgi:hypothetical protein
MPKLASSYVKFLPTARSWVALMSGPKSVGPDSMMFPRHSRYAYSSSGRQHEWERNDGGTKCADSTAPCWCLQKDP